MKKIAYLILAHADPGHLNRLIIKLDGECDIYVHIDAKSKIENFTQLIKNNNVIYLDDRVSISWGGISMVNATLMLIKVALDSGNQYSHLVLLSGSCYPIKNSRYLTKFFNLHSEHEFIKFIDMRESQNHYMKQIKYKWFKEPIFHSATKSIQIVDKSLRKLANLLQLKNSWDENDLVPYFGSQWWALTPACCKYILEYLEINRSYYLINKHTFSPDEHFFHTLVGNSIYLKNSDGVQTFQGRGTYRLANLHIIHSSLSKWYDLSDWDEISSSDKLFLRKVNSSKSNDLIVKIDEELLK